MFDLIKLVVFQIAAGFAILVVAGVFIQLGLGWVLAAIAFSWFFGFMAQILWMLFKEGKEYNDR